jgi:hypothetical protein
MTFGRHPSGNDLPDLLAAVPWWYPGAWGPPAFTVSLASVVMTAFASWYLFRNELVRAMFRFQIDSLVIALLATAVSGYIVWKTSLRPGKLPPRLWALALAAFCAGVTLWTIYAKITSSSNTPKLHALAAIGFLSCMTLTPRLFHIHPFSHWVRHAAPFALVFVFLFCFPLVLVSEKIVIAGERRGLDDKIDALEKAAKEIDGIVHSAPVKASPIDFEQTVPKKLEDVDFRKSLPDEADWKALRMLQKQTPGLPCEDRMRAAMSRLMEVLADVSMNPDAPRLAQAPFYADGVAENNDTSWRENRRFQNKAAAAAIYYHQLGRMFRDFETAGRVSPFHADYEAPASDLAKDLEVRSISTGQLWIPVVFTDKADPLNLQNLVSSRVGESDYSLGDLGHWKNATWSEAESLLKKPGCLSEAQKLQRYEIVQVADPDHPGKTMDERVLRKYQRIECYAYRPSQEGKNAEIMAELHLTYRQEWYSVPSSATPFTTLFFFDVPAKSSHYREDLMQALADQAKEIYRTTPQNRSGVSPVQGFSVSSRPATFTASPSEIRRKQDVTTIRVHVY